MKSKESRKLRLGLAFTSLWIIGFGLFLLYPVVASLFYSFCDYSVLQSPVWIGFDNFTQLFSDGVFWHSLGNTLFYTALAVPLGTIVSLSLALLLNMDVKGRAFFRTVFFLPSIIPVVASSMLWLWIFNGQFGILNAVLRPIFALWGGLPPAWFTDPMWSKPALVLMSAWGVGNSMVIYLAGLQDVPKEMYESAAIDGASAWRRFWHITLPTISPVVLFNVIMSIIASMQIFTQVFVIAGGLSSQPDPLEGQPARSLLFYTIHLFGEAFYDLRMGYASAMAWVLFVLIAVLTVTANRLASSRVHYTS